MACRPIPTSAFHTTSDDHSDLELPHEKHYFEQEQEQMQIKIFGGEPGDDVDLCYKMLEYFGTLDIKT